MRACDACSTGAAPIVVKIICIGRFVLARQHQKGLHRTLLIGALIARG